MIKEQFESVLSEEVSRRDFIKSAGVVLLAALGIPALINSVLKAFGNKKKTQSNGYGSRPYGR